jgi:hypothetical protein
VDPEFGTKGDIYRIFASPTYIDTLRIQRLSPKHPAKPCKGRQYMVFPPVQKLCLYDTNLKFSPSTASSNITELSITSTSFRSTKYDATDLIALLRQTPKLQFLCLSGAIESGPEHDPFVANQPIPPVNLVDLRFISLSESGWEAAYILLRLLPILQKPRRCGLDLTPTCHTLQCQNVRSGRPFLGRSGAYTADGFGCRPSPPLASR